MKPDYEGLLAEIERLKTDGETKSRLIESCAVQLGKMRSDMERTERERDEARRELAQAKDEHIREIERWQTEIYNYLVAITQDDSIDGGGSDGDELAFTLAEIEQAICIIVDRYESKSKTQEAHRELAELKQVARFVLNSAKEQDTYSEALNAVNAGHTPSEWIMVPVPYKWLRELNRATDPAPAPAAANELKRLRELVDSMRDDIRAAIYPDGWGYGKDWKEMMARLKSAVTAPSQPEREALIKALQFYANHNHWMGITESSDHSNLVAHGENFDGTSNGWVEAEAALARAATRPEEGER